MNNNQINIKEQIIAEIDNAFRNEKLNKTANYLTNNYLNQAKNSGFLAKAIAIPRSCVIQSSTNSGIWITNIKNDAKIFIPKNFVYDRDESRPTILIALPLFINKKGFNCFLRSKNSQRSKNIGIVKTYIFLLKINVFYYIEKGKQKLREFKQVVDETWNKTTNWFKKWLRSQTQEQLDRDKRYKQAKKKENGFVVVDKLVYSNGEVRYFWNSRYWQPQDLDKELGQGRWIAEEKIAMSFKDFEQTDTYRRLMERNII
ncbi:hypothetical protein [Mycoplasma putrefaciens]|uniref:Uncharacterized protein n=1 Tax=Mycoplasma putrefaciens Mput9231 TaxID=1292033 RepID=M9WD21_9MOLU|nr:hypothetical protein [Mycoplasma putrefaciens]AGJ90726.1 Hypothetical protein MPUT9231_3020 [Mycoplasma putrefaciens Mput9231]